MSRFLYTSTNLGAMKKLKFILLPTILALAFGLMVQHIMVNKIFYQKVMFQNLKLGIA